MDWIQVLTIIASLGGLMFFFLQRIEKDMSSFEKRSDKMDARFEKMDARFDGHAQRIDQLYRMFVDLLKEGKQP